MLMLCMYKMLQCNVICFTVSNCCAVFLFNKKRNIYIYNSYNNKSPGFGYPNVDRYGTVYFSWLAN